jgi:hypothetical protein
MAFMFRLVQEDGSPADPPTLRTAVPTWRRDDTIPLGGRTLRVVAGQRRRRRSGARAGRERHVRARH